MRSIIVLFFIISLSSVKGQTTQPPNYSCSENNASIQFTLSSSAHSAWNSTANCALQQCNTSLNDNNNCRSSSTPCYDYRTINNISYCALGILCSILERCNNITQTCSSNNSVCVINSCCSPQAVCLPFLAIQMCNTGWLYTRDMNDARAYHTASRLSSGIVLVTGGWGDTGHLNSAELYDPSIGTWATTSNMNNARYYHTASVLSNGNVLVTGGANGNILNSAELYDPSTGTWTPTGNMTNARGFHKASVLSNGKVLVTGGVDDNGNILNSAELYDPSTSTWTTTASELSNGLVLVTGGALINNRVLNSAELYDPSTGIWTTTGSMTWTRYSHTASVLSNAKVLVAGGGADTFGTCISSAELYDPLTSTWTATSHLHDARYHHTASVLSNGKVLVTGGVDISTLFSNITELY
ncbi:unnamed protein product [Adineta steineri]|uniref:Uncharacterized protein n=1 Tax=Adineta steineri TaxID=433720 RepID=A0A815NK72_9BILA|nr:unnamed protein product [Adineta steineri]CAF1434310.1 unnamed protein product [Adineta steineri]